MYIRFRHGIVEFFQLIEEISVFFDDLCVRSLQLLLVRLEFLNARAHPESLLFSSAHVFFMARKKGL